MQQREVTGEIGRSEGGVREEGSPRHFVVTEEQADAVESGGMRRTSENGEEGGGRKMVNV
eukprot:331768-Hanusia_phi.AAC.3